MRKQNSDVFKYYLNNIVNNDIRDAVKIMLNNYVPAYFYEVPASSTGKYHPKLAQGKGGLIRHTKAAIEIANSFFVNSTISKFNRIQIDIIIASLILHDSCKHGRVKQRWSRKNHPEIACELFLESIPPVDLSNDYRIPISNCIKSHMGQWGKTKPRTDLERFVHLCDYIASRKYIDMSEKSI